MTEPMQISTPTNSLKRLLTFLREEESGQDVIEYALIAAMMGLLTVAGVHGVAASIVGDLNFVLNGFNSAVGLPS